MEFITFLTERCNLNCTYCGEAASRHSLQKDVSFEHQTLIDFLRQAPDVGIHLYGGEPLLNMPLLMDILNNVPSDNITIQTNGLLLDRLPRETFDKISLLSVSLDGPPSTSNSFRGEGVQEKVLRQVAAIRERGFAGEIHARMTVTPGVDIYDSVMYFEKDCPFEFDAVHWQLNVLFSAEDEWEQDADEVIRWFTADYNPGVSRLMKYWYQRMESHGEVPQFVPFVAMMDSLLNDQPVSNVRCGAGWMTWSISTNGDIYPCPVMTSYPEFYIGNIATMKPAEITETCQLQEPCPSCEVFDSCGGRCLCSNLRNQWDDEGFDLVCGSIKHLVAELKAVQPAIQKLIDADIIDIDDFDGIQFHEIIP